MKWEVIGTKGGKRGRWHIEASNADSARRKATAAGVDVSNVQESLAASTAVAVAESPAAKPALETCGNCNRPIGRLETPQVWGDEMVCNDCYAKLPVEYRVSKPAEAISYATPVARSYGGNSAESIICPNANCGYRGAAIKKKRGSDLLAIILMWLWLIPGILYAVFGMGTITECPRCHGTVRKENGTGGNVARLLLIALAIAVAVVIVLVVVDLAGRR